MTGTGVSAPTATLHPPMARPLIVPPPAAFTVNPLNIAPQVTSISGEPA